MKGLGLHNETDIMMSAAAQAVGLPVELSGKTLRELTLFSPPSLSIGTYLSEN